MTGIIIGTSLLTNFLISLISLATPKDFLVFVTPIVTLLLFPPLSNYSSAF